MLLIVILFIYLLYIRGYKLLEGNELIDEKKEVKLMKMETIDDVLNKLLNVYEDSNQDCIGEYSEYSPCDKKCGKTYKYKTYRIKQQAGTFGAQCLEEDGAIKKQECGVSDDIYPCIIGESCQEGDDCESGNCDPKTDKCVAKKVCSNTNLNLCNKEQCLDLNNNYSYATREFKYDESESDVKCKLEDKETENNNNINDSELDQTILDLSSLTATDCIDNGEYWWLTTKSDSSGDIIESRGCELKIPNSVYYEENSNSLTLRNQIYGMSKSTNGESISGLYCKIGHTFCPEDSDTEGSNTVEISPRCANELGNKDLIGVTLPIEKSDLDNISNLESYCTEIEPICEGGGSWPDYSFFENKYNLNATGNNIVPIDEKCQRCTNGYKTNDNNNVCDNCPGTGINQFIISDTDGYRSVIQGGLIGNNGNCFSYGDSGSYTCSNSPFICGDRNKKNAPGYESGAITNINDINEFLSNCCESCPKSKYYSSDAADDSDPCVFCPSGQQQNLDGSGCEDCPTGTYSNYTHSHGFDGRTVHGIVSTSNDTGCLNCSYTVSQDKKSCSASYCSTDDILNGMCRARSIPLEPVFRSDLDDDYMYRYNNPGQGGQRTAELMRSNTYNDMKFCYLKNRINPNNIFYSSYGVPSGDIIDSYITPLRNCNYLSSGVDPTRTSEHNHDAMIGGNGYRGGFSMPWGRTHATQIVDRTNWGALSLPRETQLSYIDFWDNCCERSPEMIEYLGKTFSKPKIHLDINSSGCLAGDVAQCATIEEVRADTYDEASRIINERYSDRVTEVVKHNENTRVPDIQDCKNACSDLNSRSSIQYYTTKDNEDDSTFSCGCLEYNSRVFDNPDNKACILYSKQQCSVMQTDGFYEGYENNIDTYVYL